MSQFFFKKKFFFPFLFFQFLTLFGALRASLIPPSGLSEPSEVDGNTYRSKNNHFRVKFGVKNFRLFFEVKSLSYFGLHTYVAYIETPRKKIFFEASSVADSPEFGHNRPNDPQKTYFRPQKKIFFFEKSKKFSKLKKFFFSKDSIVKKPNFAYH